MPVLYSLPRITLRFILLFALSGVLLRAQGEFPGLTIEQARECLKTTQPNPLEGLDVMVRANTHAPGSKKIIEDENLYKKQMAAINVLIASKSIDNIKYLIPFLGYASDPGILLMGTGKKTLDEIKNVFPVYAAILNTPGMAPILASYCLDKKNSEDCRMTAFIVLRFVDIQTFKSISNDFNHQWDEGNPKMKRCLMNIEEGAWGFGGMVDVKSFMQ